MTESHPDTPTETPKVKGLHRDDVQRARRVRIACTIEFALANLVSVALAVLVVIFPEHIKTLRTVWWAIALPATIGSIALLLFHAQVVNRPRRFWAIELATWLVFPITAFASTFLMPSPVA